MHKKNKLIPTNFILALLFLAILLVRLLNLSADFPKSLNFYPDELTDEGYKTYSARNKALFNSFVIEGDEYIGWIKQSPVSQYIFLSFFSVFGVGYMQARFASVIFSLMALILYYLLIKNSLNKKIALLSTFLLGFSYVYIMYNRLALLEPIMAFFLIASLYFWQKSFKNKFYFLPSALSFVLAYYTKALAIFFVPVFLIMAYMLFKNIEPRLTNFKIALIGSALLAVVIFVVPDLISTALSLIDFRGSLSFPQILINLRRLVYNPFFKQTFIISSLSLIYPLILCYKAVERAKRINNLEIIFFAWFISLIASFSISWYEPHRYLILFLPSMCLLSSIALIGLYDYSNSAGKKFSIKNPFMKIAVFLWLNLIFIILLVNMYVFLRDYIYLNKSYYIVVSIIISLLLSYLIFIMIMRLQRFNPKYPKQYFVFILFLFIISNLYPYMVWFLTPHYALIDASRELDSILPRNSVVLGGWAPALCLETKLSCFNAGGAKNVDEGVFRQLNVTHLLIGPYDYDYDASGADFMRSPNYNKSLSLIKTFKISNNDVDLYSFNKTLYYGGID